MSPHKYVQLEKSKQNIEGIELVRLRMKSGDIPIVATSEKDRIIVFWWNATELAWQSWSRQVNPIETQGQSMARSFQLNWSNRVCITAYENNVLIVYKRSVKAQNGNTISGILIDWLTWDENTQTLNPKTIDPIRVPTSELGFNETGYYLWAVVHPNSNKLVILTQTVRIEYLRRKHFSFEDYARFDFDMPIAGKMLKNPWIARLKLPFDKLKEASSTDDPAKIANLFGLRKDITIAFNEFKELTLLSADPTAGIPNLANPTSWTILKIDDGGYHFAARLEGDALHCLYRREPYIITINDPASLDPGITQPQTIQLPSSPTDDTGYASLYYRLVKLDTNQIDASKSLDDLPGGEHPQIHKTNPMIFTIERVNSGCLQVISPYDSPMGVHVEMQLNPQVTSLQKLVLRKTAQGWIRKRLLTIPYKPRNLGFAPYYNERSSISGTKANYSILKGHLPIYLTKFTERTKKGDLMEFLFHSERQEALIIGQFDLGTSGASADLIGAQVFDINHKQIRNPYQTTPESAAENLQFSPFFWSGINDLLDNTLGGALAVDTTLDNLGFLAYTDLGDGGLRVIFDEQMPPPNPVEIDTSKKEQRLDTVQGYGLGSDEWKEITTNGWTPTKLPSYPVAFNYVGLFWAIIAQIFGGDVDFKEIPPGSIGSGLQVLLDSLIGLYYLQFTNEGQPNPIVLTKEKADPLERILSLFPDLHLESSLYDLLWSTYDEIMKRVDDPSSAYRVRINRCSITLSKYKLEYFLKNQEKDKVEITVLEDHKTEYRFIQDSEGQGKIDYRFKIEFFTDQVEIYSGLGKDLLTIDTVKSTMYYSRQFTPAIFMTEKRSVYPLDLGTYSSPPTQDPPEELIEGRDSVLAAKPLGNTTLDIPSNGVEVKTKLTWKNVGMDALLSFLIAIGLTAAVVYITSLMLAAEAALLSGPWGWMTALVIWASIFAFIALELPAIVKGKIEQTLRQQLSDPSMKETLDQKNLMTYAGEGLAETIATAILNEAGLPLNTEGMPGVNRFKRQFWQTIHVLQDKCRVLIRK